MRKYYQYLKAFKAIKIVVIMVGNMEVPAISLDYLVCRPYNYTIRPCNNTS